MEVTHKTSTRVLGIIGIILSVLTAIAIAMAAVYAINHANEAVDQAVQYAESQASSLDAYDDDGVSTIDEGDDEPDYDIDYGMDDGDEDDDAMPNGGATGTFADGIDEDDSPQVTDGLDPEEAFAGTWTLSSMVQNGKEMDADEIEMLAKLGLTVTLDLSYDGMAELNLFGEDMEGFWEALSPTEALLYMDNDTATLELEGSKLSMSGNNSSITFEKN